MNLSVPFCGSCGSSVGGLQEEEGIASSLLEWLELALRPARKTRIFNPFSEATWPSQRRGGFPLPLLAEDRSRLGLHPSCRKAQRPP